jgi:hypothetical protein
VKVRNNAMSGDLFKMDDYMSTDAYLIRILSYFRKTFFSTEGALYDWGYS